MTNRSRGIVLLLALLFALPVAAATTLYLSGWRPEAPAVHGVLVQPPLPVAHVTLGKLAGRKVQLRDFSTKWTLLYFGPADCPADCRRSLAAMRQVYVAQGRQQERVQRVFVARGAVPPDGEILCAFPGMAVVASQEVDWKGWMGGGRIFLIDPLGNRVMDYRADADPAGIRQDLARLLTYSWVG